MGAQTYHCFVPFRGCYPPFLGVARGVPGFKPVQTNPSLQRCFLENRLASSDYKMIVAKPPAQSITGHVRKWPAGSKQQIRTYRSLGTWHPSSDKVPDLVNCATLFLSNLSLIPRTHYIALDTSLSRRSPETSFFSCDPALMIYLHDHRRRYGVPSGKDLGR